MEQQDNLFDASKLQMVEVKYMLGQIEVPEEFDEDFIVNFETESSLNVGFNLETNQAKADYMLKMKTKSKADNKTEASGNFHFVFFYKISNLSELTNLHEDDTLNIDVNLANALSAISYSTSRGILLTRLQGSAFSKFILPIIDPTSLLGQAMNNS